MCDYEKIANSKRPFACVFAYDTGSHGQGDVLSTHKSQELAEKASKRSGYDSFIAVRYAPDYVQ